GLSLCRERCRRTGASAEQTRGTPSNGNGSSTQGEVRMAKKYETVLIEKSGDGITWLIMNRPDKRNAMSPQLHLDIDDALQALSTTEETEILILTGAGDTAFCAGQDIRLYFRGTEQDPKTRAKA